MSQLDLFNEEWDDLAAEEIEEQAEPESYKFWEGSFSAVPLADTRQYLIVDGPQAGQISDDPKVNHRGADAAPEISDRDDSLDSDLPVFIAHRGGQHFKHLPHALVRLHQAEGNYLKLGTTVRIPVITEDDSRAFFTRCAVAPIRIADPVCYIRNEAILRLPKDPISNRASQRAPYLKGERADGWVSQLLDAQRNGGANLLLTPGLALDPGNARETLDSLFEDSEQALSLLKEKERLALNITVSSRWLTAEDLRKQLFNELLDREEYSIWYVRVQWRSRRSFEQASERDLLEGYKRLAELAIDENRILILPQTGLTGWLMLAFGAKGFCAGTSSSQQAFTEPGFGRTKGSARRERYFEKQLLHSVDRSVHDVLSEEAEYEHCDCPYCVQLFDGPAWSHELAGLHNLYCMGQLTAAVKRDSSRGGHHSAIRRMVRDAMSFAADKDLGDVSAPKHLAVWGQLL